MFERCVRFKLADDRGRTICRFSKRSYFDADMQHRETEPWAAEAKPEKRRTRSAPTTEGRLPPLRVRRTEDGRRYLELPGLTLKWEKVEAVLERMAVTLELVDASGVVLTDDLDAATLTTKQLRMSIG